MPADKKDIPGECGLLRRVTPSQIVPDANLGKRRLSSGAFRDRQLSADAECLLLNEGLDWTFSLKDYPQFFLVRILAAQARQHAQVVEHCPLPDNDFHTEIIGRKSSTICDALRLAAEWGKKPDDV
jgi:hypothetical protein